MKKPRNKTYGTVKFVFGTKKRDLADGMLIIKTTPFIGYEISDDYQELKDLAERINLFADWKKEHHI